MTDKEFLLAVVDYIESTEVLIEYERGIGRTLERLIATSGAMPPLYAEVLRRINEQS